MSKCRYDLSEDCNNTNCLNCVLDKIRAEIKDIAFDWQEIDGEHESFMVVDLNDALSIIDKYKADKSDTGIDLDYLDRWQFDDKEHFKP